MKRVDADGVVEAPLDEGGADEDAVGHDSCDSNARSCDRVSSLKEARRGEAVCCCCFC